VSLTQSNGTIAIRDLYMDVIIPFDGRHHRMLDLEEFADAIEAGHLSLAEAVDGMRRWQTFLDRYVHMDRMPSDTWSDFPNAMRPLINLSPTAWNEAIRLADDRTA